MAATRSHVGAHVDSAAVREVAGRLLEEGRSRLDSAPESALVALRQAFSLEQQFGVDGERLHRTVLTHTACRSRAACTDRPPAVFRALPVAQGSSPQVSPHCTHGARPRPVRVRNRGTTHMCCVFASLSTAALSAATLSATAIIAAFTTTTGAACAPRSVTRSAGWRTRTRRSQRSSRSSPASTRSRR